MVAYFATKSFKLVKILLIIYNSKDRIFRVRNDSKSILNLNQKRKQIHLYNDLEKFELKPNINLVYDSLIIKIIKNGCFKKKYVFLGLVVVFFKVLKTFLMGGGA